MRSKRRVPFWSDGISVAPDVSHPEVKVTCRAREPARSELSAKRARPLSMSVLKTLQPAGSARMHGTRSALGTACASSTSALKLAASEHMGVELASLLHAAGAVARTSAAAASEARRRSITERRAHKRRASQQSRRVEEAEQEDEDDERAADDGGPEADAAHA